MMDELQELLVATELVIEAASNLAHSDALAAVVANPRRTTATCEQIKANLRSLVETVDLIDLHMAAHRALVAP